MISAPLHPAIVHVPIGISFVLPLFALGATLLLWRRHSHKSVWIMVVVLQAVVLAGGVASTNTGEADRRQTVVLVGSRYLDPHEEHGRNFNVSAAISLALGVASLFPGPGAIANASRVAAVAATAASASLAYAAGRSGGELVYRRGAARAYQPDSDEK